MNNDAIHPSDYQPIAAQYQQWLADRDLQIALLNVRVGELIQKAALVPGLEQERDDLRAEVVRLQAASGETSEDATPSD